MSHIIIYIAITLSGLSSSVQAVEFDNLSESTYSQSVEAESEKNSEDDNKTDSIASRHKDLFVYTGHTQIYSKKSFSFTNNASCTYLTRAPPHLA